MSPRHGIDEDFLALPLSHLADAALSAATAGGASYADLRVHAITTEIVQLRDGELESATLDCARISPRSPPAKRWAWR